MKSDEIYDGVTVKNAVEDVLNACRSEKNVMDAPYANVTEKTERARGLVLKFIYILIREEYKDAYKKDKTAECVFTCSMIVYDYFVRRLSIDKIAKMYTKTADKADENIIMDIIAACVDAICNNVAPIYSMLEDWATMYMIHTWREVTENKTA